MYPVLDGTWSLGAGLPGVLVRPATVIGAAKSRGSSWYGYFSTTEFVL